MTYKEISELTDELLNKADAIYTLNHTKSPVILTQKGYINSKRVARETREATKEYLKTLSDEALEKVFGLLQIHKENAQQTQQQIDFRAQTATQQTPIGEIYRMEHEYDLADRRIAYCDMLNQMRKEINAEKSERE